MTIATDDLIDYANTFKPAVGGDGNCVWRCDYAGRNEEMTDRLCLALNDARVWMGQHWNWWGYSCGGWRMHLIFNDD